VNGREIRDVRSIDRAARGIAVAIHAGMMQNCDYTRWQRDHHNQQHHGRQHGARLVDAPRRSQRQHRQRTTPATSPMPCRMRSNWPTMVPAVWVSGRKVLNVMAATIGKKISAPIQTMRAHERSVRSKVFIEEGYKEKVRVWSVECERANRYSHTHTRTHTRTHTSFS